MLFRIVFSNVCLTQIPFKLQNFVTFVYLDSSLLNRKQLVHNRLLEGNTAREETTVVETEFKEQLKNIQIFFANKCTLY
jgi:hypothetical protein